MCPGVLAGGRAGGGQCGWTRSWGESLGCERWVSGEVMGHYDNAGFPLRHMWSQWMVSREGTHLREGFLRLTERCVESGRAEEAGSPVGRL